MAGRGPAPKANRARPTDDKRRQAEFTLLSMDGVERGPDLPEGVIEWPEQTRIWWHELRTSPMAATWLAVDWQHLLDTALLHADFWTGNPKVGAEIRQRLMAYGVTPEARLRLRLMVETEQSAATESTLDRLRREKADREGMTPARRRRVLKAMTDSQTTPAPTPTKGTR